MLEKDPDRRPYVKDIVKSDYMKGHISRLLSHTLKAGNGGVGNVISSAAAAAANANSNVNSNVNSNATPTAAPAASKPSKQHVVEKELKITQLSLEEIEYGIEQQRRKEREELKLKNDAETKVK